MLNLSEIFCSIQGESSFAGLPCIFIRLAGCNLRCSYCDSEYSHETNFQMQIPDVISKISEFDPVKLVEITGGEPLMQEELYPLIYNLIELDYQVLLETNGSLNLQRVPSEVIKIVDIKCPGSGCPESFLLENLQYINRADEIKFVLTDRKDFDWAKAIIIEYDLQEYNLIFSPAYSLLEPQELAKWILDESLKVRLQLQLHKYIWDPNARGV